jgi:hypothetical protein
MRTRKELNAALQKHINAVAEIGRELKALKAKALRMHALAKGK